MGKKYTYVGITRGLGGCEYCRGEMGRHTEVHDAPLEVLSESTQQGCAYCGNDYESLLEYKLVDVCDDADYQG